MIEVKNLTKNYGDKRAVDNISFTANDGEILGFLGPNGAGKSTTMNILTGYISSTSGSALINGVDILEDPIKAKSNIGYLPELPPLYLDMTVKSYLNFIFDLKKCKLPRKSHLTDICELCKITDVKERIIKHLSKGYKQRVGLAQAILHDPELLLLDEPTDGLDPNQKHQVRQLVKNLSESKIVVISTHILEEVSFMCSRALVIGGGRLLADSTPLELASRSRYHQAVTLYSDEPLDAVALAVLPGVAGIEENPAEGSLTVLAQPGAVIFPQVSGLVAERGWRIRELDVERGRLDEVFRNLTRGTEA